MASSVPNDDNIERGPNFDFADDIKELLAVARTHLQMDIGFVSEFVKNKRVIRYVDADGSDSVIKAGMSVPLRTGYCMRVVAGKLPELIPDTAQCEAALKLPETKRIPIGSHISVPIRMQDGTVYGTFCCFSAASKPKLNERDLNVLRAFAALAATRLEGKITEDRVMRDQCIALNEIISKKQIDVVYQPIFHLKERVIFALEGLSRFPVGAVVSPEYWFSAANKHNLRIALERVAIEKALSKISLFPKEINIGVNLSPRALLSSEIADTLIQHDLRRVILEITEHEIVEDYENLSVMLSRFRQLGAKVAVDDAGAGFSSFRHILRLRPEFIKLDASLVRDIASSLDKRALAEAIITFSNQTGAKVVAEGIESKSELDSVIQLGVHYAQGYLLGKPASFELAQMQLGKTKSN